jgi:hypothetical protein
MIAKGNSPLASVFSSTFSRRFRLAQAACPVEEIERQTELVIEVAL